MNISHVSDFIRTIPPWTCLVAVSTSVVYVLSTIVRVKGINLVEVMSLNPHKVFENLQIHRVVTYSLVHLNIFHWLTNTISLVPYLSRFEREKGTLISSFLVMQCVFITAVIYSLISFFTQANATLAGSSGAVFSLMAYYAVQDYSRSPAINIGNVAIPSWALPLAWICIIGLLVPQASFVGRAILGYCYANCQDHLCNPSEWIMAKVEPNLSHINGFVTRAECRDDGYTTFSTTVNPIGNIEDQRGLSEPSGFQGVGRRLGS